MNAVMGVPLLGGLARWVFLWAAILTAAAVMQSRQIELPSVPEYKIELRAASAPPARWQPTTLAAVRLHRDEALSVRLQPVSPVSGPVALRLFTQGQNGDMSEWQPTVPPELRPDGSIWLHSALPSDLALRQEITFLITRPGADGSLDALGRASAAQRLLHVSVTRSPL